MKSVKAFAWLLLVGALLFLSFSYVREALLVDSCLDSGGSFDYLRMMCDREANHGFIPYSQRHGTIKYQTKDALRVGEAQQRLQRTRLERAVVEFEINVEC